MPLLTSVFSVSSRTRTGGSTEITQGPTRCRSRGKREKDKTRQEAWDERRRLFQETFHDNVDSIGEVDARTGSEALSVDRGDVLRDPKTPSTAIQAWHTGGETMSKKADDSTVEANADISNPRDMQAILALLVSLPNHH